MALRLYIPWVFCNGANTYSYLSIWQGAVGAGTSVGNSLIISKSSNDAGVGLCYAEVTLIPGTYTFNASGRTTTGWTSSFTGAPNNKTYFTAEVVG